MAFTSDSDDLTTVIANGYFGWNSKEMLLDEYEQKYRYNFLHRNNSVIKYFVMTIKQAFYASSRRI